MTSSKETIFDRIHLLSEISSNYDVILFDIWGVILDGEGAYPGIINEVNNIIASKKVRFVSNAPRLASTTAKRLKDLGLNVSDEIMITSGEIARQMLRHPKELLKINDPLKIYHLGEEQNKDILSGFNFKEASAKEANLLIISAFSDEDSDNSNILTTLESFAENNVQALCTNPDNMLSNCGKIRYCAGYYSAIYESMGGKVIYSGKPQREIFDFCLGQFPGVDKKKFLMIGDTFATDIIGSHNVGIDSALVLTGNMSLLIANYDDEILIAANKVCLTQTHQPKYLLKI